MAHIGIFQKGSTGFLHSTLELMNRLEAEGHSITCLSVWDCRNKVESLGFKYIPLPEVDFSYELNSTDPRRKSFKYRLTSNLKGKSITYQQGKEILKIAEFEKILKELNFDLVLSTMELHEVILGSKLMNIPVIIISDWFSFTRRKGLPPIRTSVVPGIGFFGSNLGIPLAWFYTKARIYARSVLNKLLLKDNRKSVLIKYANEAGVLKADLISRNFPSVFIYRNIPTLSMTMKELEFPHDFAANIQYIGSMVNEQRSENDLDAVASERLLSIFNLKEKTGKKIIYLSMSTLKSVDSEFFQRTIEAIGRQKDWLLIMTTAGNDPGNKFESLPENVFYFKWLPQLTVLKHTDCSINHGGINTINECIHFGVPMLIYSGQQYDQSGCAARVHYHKLGIMGDHRDSAEDIHSNLERILNNQDYQSAIDLMQQSYFEQRNKSISPYLRMAE